MWMRRTAHSHSLSFLFFSFLPKTHDGGCAIVRPGCRVFFFSPIHIKRLLPQRKFSLHGRSLIVFVLWYCEANQQASVSFTRPSRIETLLSQSLPLGGRWHLRQQMTEGVYLTDASIVNLNEIIFSELSPPASLTVPSKEETTQKPGSHDPGFFHFIYDIFRRRQYSVPDTAVPAP